MRKSLSILLLLFLSILFVKPSYSQADKFAYAITDLQKTGAGWNALRMLDTKSGTFTDVLLNGADAKQLAYDAVSKKTYMTPAGAQINQQAAFSTGVAAMAYDRHSKRLYYTPMFIDQLRYVDLRTMKPYYFSGQAFANTNIQMNEQAKIITRMVIAPDGYGYAVSNDGDYFVRFSTDKKLQVNSLGALIDDPANNGVSIHNSCSGYGGDMIADDAGNLYIITNSKNVFKVDIASRVASYLGNVKGLPNEFTVNGMVVNDEGQLLVSSASAEAYYVVNPKSWSAEKYKIVSDVYRSSDLANSNYLSVKKNESGIATILERQSLLSDQIQLYPNPVSRNTFAIRFNKLDAGNYVVSLSDIMGREILRKKVNVFSSDQTENVNIRSIAAKGIYMVKVMNEESKTLFYQKLVVQ